MHPDGSYWDGIEIICPTCGKPTIDDPLVPENNNPVQSVEMNQKGWVKCPCCARRFKPESDYFRNGRHRMCGQALVIKDAVSS